LLTQGFPELVGVQDPIVIRKYLRESIVEKVVYRDLPSLVRLRDASLLESLLNLLAEEPGQLLEYGHLGRELGVERHTLSNYLTYLEQSFLLRKLYNFSRGRRKTERKLRKFYPTVVSPSLTFRSDDLSRSRVFEWLAVSGLRAESFWRDPYRHEVDVILGERTPVPVEAKYGALDFDGLQAFMERFHVRRGYLVTPNREDVRRLDGKTVHVVPIVKVLLDPSILRP